MLTEVDLVTVLVVTVKFALVSPCGTVTIEGTLATAVLLLDSEIKISVGAGPFNLTVPVEILPPTTVEGLRETDASRGTTVRVSDLVTPP
jgi:hypothetical protein